MMLKALLFVVAFAAFSPLPSYAVEPDEVLRDPALEARARELGRGLRCVVCQNQSIDESNAELARDMRVLVRDRITSGDTNEQVLSYMVDRYGDFVLLDPPFKTSTLVLWLGPGAIAVFGLFAVVVFYRRNQSSDDETAVVANPQTAPLSDEERKRLDALLKDDDA